MIWIGLIIAVIIFSLMQARYEDKIICLLKGGGMLLGVYVGTRIDQKGIK